MTFNNNLNAEMLYIATKYDLHIYTHDHALIQLMSLGLSEAQAERLLSRKDEGTLVEVWR